MQRKDQLRKQIIQYFRSVGSGENIVQCIKEALFLHERFNPIAVFEMLSKSKQKLQSSDIRNYLLSHNIGFSEEQLRYYLQINNYKPSSISLNDFLQSMIPYNADVVREFKQKYLDSLQIKVIDPEIDFILAELFENHFKFIRSLITLREELTAIASRKQIEKLVKQDLVLHSKPRQARKFHEAFQTSGFVLGFHELRKFLELWLSSKEISHEFYLLNVMRHLKSDNPFERIVYKNKTTARGSSGSAKKRAYSAKHRATNEGFSQLTNDKLREKLGQQSDEKYQTHDGGFFASTKDEKYEHFKKGITDQLNKKTQSAQKSHAGPQTRPMQSNQKKSNDRKEENRQHNGDADRSAQKAQLKGEIKTDQAHRLRQSKYERQSKGINGELLIDMLTEMSVKEQRLQKLRKNLAKANDFNLINLFKLLDSRNKGYITAGNIAQYTESNKVNFSPLVNFYAREQDRLRFHEFCLIFRPLSKQLNELIDSRQQHKVQNPFKKDTIKLIHQVLLLTGQMQANLNDLRRQIKQSRVSSTSLFYFADMRNQGYLTAECLQEILSENNIFSNDKNLKCLMKLFRKKVDEKISQTEFLEFLDM